MLQLRRYGQNKRRGFFFFFFFFLSSYSPLLRHSTQPCLFTCLFSPPSLPWQEHESRKYWVIDLVQRRLAWVSAHSLVVGCHLPLCWIAQCWGLFFLCVCVPAFGDMTLPDGVKLKEKCNEVVLSPQSILMLVDFRGEYFTGHYLEMALILHSWMVRKQRIQNTGLLTTFQRQWGGV